MNPARTSHTLPAETLYSAIVAGRNSFNLSCGALARFGPGEPKKRNICGPAPLLCSRRWMVGFSLLMVLAMACTGCQSTSRTVSSHSSSMHATGVSFLEKADGSTRGLIPDQENSLEIMGKGLASSQAATDIQKRLTAQQAAKYRAMAELVERTRGIHVTREASVKDMAFAEEKVDVQLSGQVEGVMVVREDYDEDTGMAEVTLRVALDKESNVDFPGIKRAPLSLPERRARAEEAARINAMAALRREVGQVHVEEDILISDLVMIHQNARQYIEGKLENVKFSKPEWVTEDKCEVTAKVKLTPSDLKRLRYSGGQEEESKQESVEK